MGYTLDSCRLAQGRPFSRQFCCMEWSRSLFSGYWLVAGIVLYLVSSEFFTQMVSSQLVFNLLSSQEYIHRLYHWEEWLPGLCDQDPEMCRLSTGRLDCHLIGGPWIGLIWLQRWLTSHRLASTGVWVDLLREQRLSFLPGSGCTTFPLTLFL